MEQKECSATLAYKILTLGNYPEESIQQDRNYETFSLQEPHQHHLRHLKSRFMVSVYMELKIPPRHNFSHSWLLSPFYIRFLC